MVPATARSRSVVIVHEHGLLGEGLAQYLFQEAGVHARLVTVTDEPAVRGALARRPAVVVYESSLPGGSGALAAQCPGAVLIDVSGVFTDEVAAGPAVLLGRILDAVGSSAPPA